jgi:hypothetical protein
MKTIYLLLVFFLATACDKEDPVVPASLLPPITMTGENTFGCLIDGKFFKPRDGNGTIGVSTSKGLKILRTEQNNFEISIDDFKSDKTTSLIIHLEELFIMNEGIYQVNESNGLRGLDGNDNTYMTCRIWKDSEVGYQRYYSYQNSGLIEITKREFSSTSNHIFSGTFKSKLINFNNVNDTISIEAGRFDINAFTVDTTTYN